MIKYDDLIKIKESLEELTPSPEQFDWGPSLGLAEKRREYALSAIKSEIAKRKPKK